MEVSFKPFQINISTMSRKCITEDNSMYEECSICCESFTNKSFVNECLHPFCYQCIINWTKVKAVCPLCIGPITSVLHNIRSQDDYDIEKVESPGVNVLANINNDFIFDVDDTDTESSYGGMIYMDTESDYDNDDETENFFGYLSNNESSHDDASEHSNEHNESEETQEYYNVDSESDAEGEHADDEDDCDSNGDNNDADSENDNDNNYLDNYDYYDEDNDDGDEEEPEHEYSANSDDDYDANEEAETFDVSDDSCEESDVEYSANSDDDYDANEEAETFDVSDDSCEESDVESNPTYTSEDEL